LSEINVFIKLATADLNDRAASGVDLRPLACWDCGFESRRRHGYLSLVSAVCCQVEVSASGWSYIQRRGPTERGVSWVWSWSFDSEEVLAH